MLRLCWSTLGRATPHLLGAFVVTGVALVAVTGIVAARLLGDWDLLGLRDLYTPNEYWDAGWSGSVDLVRDRLWARAGDSGRDLGRDVVVAWAVWFVIGAWCQAYAVAAVASRARREPAGVRTLAGRAARAAPRLALVWAGVTLVVWALVWLPTRVAASASWLIAAPVAMLATGVAVVLLSRLLLVPVAAVEAHGHRFGAGGWRCLRDGWRNIDRRWAMTLGRSLVVATPLVVPALGVGVLLVVLALSALQIQLAIAFAMLSVVMLVTIGAASAASVWYVSTGADGVRPLP
ncbi:MAG: hypothetical protein R2690_00445 [Acidimicrobiales bacterium]